MEDLAGTCSTLFSSELFWDRFLLDLRSFFGTRFRYKLMYYYFYHGSNLRKIMWNQFLPNLSCLQNNPPENNMEDLAGTCSTLFSSELFWDRFLLDLRSRVPTKSFTLFSGGLFWDQFLLDLSFFGARFRYKLMYYYFYHGSHLREIMWNQFPPNLSCLQNNPPENNEEDLAGTCST